MQGLSPIYEGYLRTPELLGDFAAAAEGVWPGQAVALEVGWDGPADGGRFTLYVPTAESRALPMARALAAGEPLDPSVLSPLLAPLAALRSALGGRFDLRFLGFRLELAFLDPESGEHCVVSGDLNDPEGRRVGACFRCGPGGKGEALCRQGDGWPGLISGSPADLEQLSRTLSPVASSPPVREGSGRPGPG